MPSGDHEGTTRHMSHTFSAANGISVIHRQQGLNSLIQRKGHVEIEGTKENDISVIVDFEASSNVLAEGLEVSVDGNELIVTVFNYLILELILDHGDALWTARFYSSRCDSPNPYIVFTIRQSFLYILRNSHLRVFEL
jgi:hypothetical protein